MVSKRRKVCPTTKTKAPALLLSPAARGPRKCGCELLLDKIVSVCVSFFLLGQRLNSPSFGLWELFSSNGNLGNVGNEMQVDTEDHHKKKEEEEEGM